MMFLGKKIMMMILGKTSRMILGNDDDLGYENYDDNDFR